MLLLKAYLVLDGEWRDDDGGKGGGKCLRGVPLVIGVRAAHTTSLQGVASVE